MHSFGPSRAPAPSYDRASLSNQRALPGRTLASSVKAGWRSALIERMHWPAGATEFETKACTDLRVSMVLRGAHATDVWMDGQWCRTDAPVGAIAVTAASDVDALRWRSDVPIETVHLFIPADTIAIAASQLQAAGTRSHTTAPLVSFADSAVSSVLIGLLQAAQQGAPDLYASNTVHWLAMHLLLTQRLEQTGEPVRTPDPRIERAIACIHQRYVEPLSLAQLAAVACLSRFHFARLFRLETGMSPHAYLLAHRMQAAKDLLAATDVPIAQIARRTGFVRAAQFAVAFRSAAGLTATEFRQRSNADQAELRDRGVHSNAGKPPQR